MRRGAAALLAAGLLAACGGGGGGGEAQTVIDEQDQARAEAIVLQAGDFPQGWTSSPHEESGAKTCLDPDLSDLVVSGDADSRDFSSPPYLANSSATIMQTAGQAEAAFERYATGDLPRCIAEQLGKTIEESSDVEIDVTETSVEPLDFPALGDATQAYRAALDLEIGGQPARAYVDFVFLRRERAIATIAFASILQAPRRNLNEELATRVAGRMEP